MADNQAPYKVIYKRQSGVTGSLGPFGNLNKAMGKAYEIRSSGKMAWIKIADKDKNVVMTL